MKNVRPILDYLHTWLTAILLLVFTVDLGAAETVTDSKPTSKRPFLSWAQRGQLIWTGSVRGENNTWYDVWVCPGFTGPAAGAWTGLQRVQDDFAEYVGSRKYRRAWAASAKIYRWTFQDCLHDYLVVGTGEAWTSYFRQAHDRADNRLFGWCIVYPWALGRSLVDIVIRVPVGVCGTVGGTANGTVVIPGYHAVDSSVKGVYHLSTKVVVRPAVAWTWNILVSPPLAAVGRQPDAAHADGFWIQAQSETERQRSHDTELAPDDNQVRTVLQWGRVLLEELGPFEERKRQLRIRTHEQVQRAYNDERREQENIRAEQELYFRNMLSDPKHRGILDNLKNASFDASRLENNRTLLRRRLDEDRSLTDKQRDRIVELLRRYMPSALEPGERGADTIPPGD